MAKVLKQIEIKQKITSQIFFQEGCFAANWFVHLTFFRTRFTS